MRLLNRLWAMTALAVSTIAAPTPNRALVSRAVSSDILQQLELFAQYSAASYCERNINSAGDKLTCKAGNCAIVQEAETTTLYEFENENDVAGYLAADTTNNLLVLSFRGSRTIDNWIDNIDFIQEDITDVCNDCWAHGGWWDAWQEVADELSGQIKDAVNQYPDYKMVFTGHSLGGALATIAATVLRNEGYTIDLYTYGSPRVGNEALSEYITAQGTLYRVTHTNDVVPKLPPPIGYAHPSPEYWVTSGNYETVTTEDVEAIEGTNSTAGNAGTDGVSVIAHLHYFGNIAGCI
ncbi:lipase family protein [Aspergillus chevalieri]|uniref:feruloyl esterase n=1 Tax=Aspergillus chevalieri TaxID=182096 RepID=A0A7R7ZPQ6_ASPCH|nr:uncharacterized protein ACHE_51051A [Aspergillus chevalieri]BCR89853.1 hypothetical protein ACHE_51051A [Aspergillus chevalieri]